MKNYYKGFIFRNTFLNKKPFEVCIINNNFTDYTSFYKKLPLLNQAEKEFLLDEINVNSLSENSLEILKKLNVLGNNQPFTFEAITFSTGIIFEIIKDEYGNAFGKELLTGSIFPIFGHQASYVLKKERKEKAFYTPLAPQNIWLEKNGYFYNKTTELLLSSDKFKSDPNYSLIDVDIKTYELKYENDLNNANQMEYLIELEDKAKQNEINVYIKNRKNKIRYFKIVNDFKDEIRKYEEYNLKKEKGKILKLTK